MTRCARAGARRACASRVISGHTDALLNGQSTLKDIKRQLFEQDWESCVTEASHHDSTAVAAAISSSVSWLKLWDMALDHGPRATHSLQLLYRTLTRPSFQSKCRLCEPETALIFPPLCSLSHSYYGSRLCHQLPHLWKYRHIFVCQIFYPIALFYFFAMPLLVY